MAANKRSLPVSQEEQHTQEFTQDRDSHFGLIEYFGRCGSRAAILRGLVFHLQDYFELLTIFQVQDERVRWIEGSGPGFCVPGCLRKWTELSDYALLSHCALKERAYCGTVKPGSGEADLDRGFLQDIHAPTWASPLLGGEQTDFVILARGARKRPLQCTEWLECVIGQAALALQRVHITNQLLQHKSRSA